MLPKVSSSSSDRKRRDHNRLVRLFAPIIVCVFLLFALFAFLLLQGDMNSWVAFMGGEASMALFYIYCAVGVAGILTVTLLKKELRILEAPNKILAVSFLATIFIGWGVFTYLNYSATQANYAWMSDGLVYQQMGQSFLQNHEFILNGQYTHHLGPVYPIYLSFFYVFLPVQLGTHVAVEIAFTLSIIVTFALTRKLYGIPPALITTAIVTTFPTYLFSVSRNYSEPFLLIMYTLTIYFIIESLKPEKANRIIFAGLCAGIGFLTKSGIGYFFLITGIAGFLWRFYYMRWRVFKNRNYVIAITVFLTIVLIWAARNLYLFWDGTLPNFLVASQSSDYFYRAMVYSLTVDFWSFFVQFWFFMVLTSFFIISYLWIFFDYVKKAVGKIRDERISCLLLAITLPLLLTWAIGAIYFVYENQWMPHYWITYYPVSQVRYLVFNLIRYCFIAVVPLSWLAYETAQKEKNQIEPALAENT
jgi:hypothetical protein